MKQYTTKIISAFPATGKTYLFNNSYKKVADSDSSKFDKKNFPDNYIKHIKESIGKFDIICVSSHKEVREALVKNGIEFTLIYPAISLKEEYVERFKKRGNNDKFIKLISDNWTDWLIELQFQGDCTHVVLKSGEYITL